MELKIKDAATVAGISVRTLHHWDNIGLLSPLKTVENGYRLYSESDLEKLQQILFFKELDFSLSEIKMIINDPGFDRRHAFKLQRDLLQKKRGRIDSIISTLEISIQAMEDKATMSNKNRFDAFDMSKIEEHRKKYAAEVRDRFGSSNAYMESNMKTSNYTSQDWERITSNGNKILSKIGDLIDSNPDSPEAFAAVEKWRSHITDSYYNCSLEILSGLGEMYISDERFKKNIDKIKPGLSEFLSAIIKNYCKSR